MSLLEFRFAPDVSMTGSVTDALPKADTAGGFLHPVEDLVGLEGFFISTSRTYAAADFDEDLPGVREGWVFVGGGTPRIADDLEFEMAAALESIDCSDPA